MTAAPLRIGTRASELALTQSGHVGAALVDGTGHETELVHVSTHGDRDRTSPLAQIGGTGVFVTAVRQALLDGEVDVVVHSWKDLPTAPLAEITLACTPAREDPRDALCARDGMTLAQLPAGARVGTGSPRRAAQLLRARRALEVGGIRGDVEPRRTRARGPAAAHAAGDASDGAPSTPSAAPGTADAAISYVVVPGDRESSSGLRGTLDSSPLLEKVTEGTTGGMWRVIDAAPRAVVLGGESPVVLESALIDAHGTLEAEPSERTVVLSERHDSQWRATLDGTELAATEVDGWAQGFTVPAGAEGELEIHRDQPARLLWQLLLYGATGVTALIAIPWRVRTRTAEEMYG